MASVDPKLIQDIRIRKQAQELLKRADEFKAMRDRLVELSGIKERGINPEELKVNKEYLPTLMKAAHEALEAGKLFTEDSSGQEADAKPKGAARRQMI